MKQTYQAVLFAPDGEYVTDFRDREEKEEVWNEINDMGSRWIFYPIPFVATDKTIVSTPEGLEHLRGKRISTVVQVLASADQDALCKYINNGWPIGDLI